MKLPKGIAGSTGKSPAKDVSKPTGLVNPKVKPELKSLITATCNKRLQLEGHVKVCHFCVVIFCIQPLHGDLRHFCSQGSLLHSSRQ